MDKLKTLNSIDCLADELYELSDKVWDAAELAFTEFNSVDLECAFLEKHGFKVEKGIGGIPTAYCGTFGSGKPVIGFLGEFDALGGLSKVPEEFKLRQPQQENTAHGCGHNLLGVSSIAAAIIVKKYLEDNNKEGTVVYFGCPGEEGGSGKAFMAREGLFDQLDSAITWHPGTSNGVFNGGSQANMQVKYIFKGVSSHAAGAPELGRSALDALELMNVGVQFLREHVASDTRIHYSIIDTGGKSPNVVQSSASAIYLIRSSCNKNVVDLKRRVDLIARGAAMMTETEVEIDFMKACSDYRSNAVLDKITQKNLEELPIPAATEEELAYLKKINETCPSKFKVPQSTLDMIPEEEQAAFIKKCEENDQFDFVMPLEPYKHISGSTDVGDVSNVCPTTQLYSATWASNTPGHSWQVVAQGTSSFTKKRSIYSAKVMAGIAIDLFENPETIEKAKALHKKNFPEGYLCPIPKGVKPRSIG